MSTTFTLLPIGGEPSSCPSIELTEASMKFGLSIYWPDAQLEWNGLTADEVIQVATKMLQVVLYSYPEKHAEIIAAVQQIRP